MAIVNSSYTYEIRRVTLRDFTVNFTDTTAGSPTNWLWDFGDGFCSNEQNPTHIYKGKWEKSEQDFTPDAIFHENGDQITYTVRLTAWKNGTILAPNSPAPETITFLYNDEEGFVSQSEAQGALDDTLPFTSWTTSNQVGFTGLKYYLLKPAASWRYGSSYRDTSLDFSAYPLETHVAWMELRINSMIFGEQKYAGGEYYSVKTGKWDEELNDFDENEIAIRIGNLSIDVNYPYFSMEDYLGDLSTDKIRAMDAFGWGRHLLTGGLDRKGYVIYPTAPELFLQSVASTDDIGRSSQSISANPNILTRPPALYSGIKEAYFNDGWENEKYFYVEQSSPYPCIIEFIDIYAKTSNE